MTANRLHLAYVVNQFPALSETFVAREVVALRDRGLRVDVYTFREPSEADRERMSAQMQSLADEAILIEPELPSLGHLAKLPALARTNARLGQGHRSSPLGRLGRAFALARRVRATGAQRLHAHWPLATMITHLASELTGVPYSVSIHAHEVAHENGHFSEAFRRAEWAAFCNAAAMEYLLGRLPAEARERSHLVYHGVETQRFDPLPMPVSAAPFRVVSAGRLTPTKGFDRLVRACARARERGTDVRLAILGQGAEEETLRQIAAETGYTDALDLPGWVSHDRVPDYFRASHLFALPASTGFHDGLPNVVLEAMASARPVLLSPLPAAAEAVTDGVEGVILDDENDVEALADAIARLATETERLGEMGEAARRRVVAEHDAEGQVDRLLGLHMRASKGAA